VIRRILISRDGSGHSMPELEVYPMFPCLLLLLGQLEVDEV
jgi:hypothetical protein